MDDKKCLVSICIPTYNRASYLQKCLDSLVGQPEFLNEDVEIVISDNASTDNTMTIVHNYQKRYKNIQYYKNSKNCGFQNLGLAIARGNGCLRKLGNDTLIYRKGSLHYFCDIAARYHKIKPIVYFSNEILGRTGDSSNYDIVTYNNFNDFLHAVSFNITWIGTFALWNEDCTNVEVSAMQSDSDLWHVEYTFSFLSGKKEMILCPLRFANVQEPKNKDLTYGVYKVFYENYLSMVFQLRRKNVINEECYMFLKKDLLFRFFLNGIIEWEEKDPRFKFSNHENLKELVFTSYQSEDYFEAFKELYYSKRRLYRIKKQIKKIPILGLVIVNIKRTLRNK